MQDLTGVNKQLWENVQSIQPKLIEIADYIHDNPELGREEFKACEILTKTLEEWGFKVTREAGGLPTAFVAEYAPNPKGPVIGICAEYDALPGMGHGCGHQIIATGALGAAYALKPLMDSTPGVLRVYGTPAEESTGDKVLMMEAGLFDDVDFTMHCHANDRTTTTAKFKALHVIDFIFHGVTAHAAREPEKGISALNAVMIGYNSVEYLRNHVKKDVSIAGYIMNGGDAFNRIPDYAACRYAIRSDNGIYLKKVVERVINCFKGAELATGATLEIQHGMVLDSNINVPTFDKIMLDHAIEVGAKQVMEPTSKASSDFSNVTMKIPGSRLDIAFGPVGVSTHSPRFAEVGKEPMAHESIAISSYAMAATSYDLLTHPELCETIKAEHKDEIRKMEEDA